MDEIEDLHISMERLEEQKRSLEEQAAEQAKTCRELSDANDALSARTLALADESSSGPPGRLMDLENQIMDLRKRLADANDELDRTRAAESVQRVALLDELNSLQDENGNLRNQLRQRPPAGK
jgi:predicted  nucleic acid-binding Zn-ribbon protein